MSDDSTHGSVTLMISQLALDQPSRAQEALWNRYFRRLVALARLKLRETPRRVADEEDVATVALASFFADQREGKFPQLHDRTDLWPLLATITANKAVDQQRQILAQKRGADQVRGDSIRGPEGEWLADWPARQIDEELQPEYLVMMSEECDRLLAMLGDDELCLIARRRLEGYTNSEIARELKVIVRTVERRVKLIRTIWEGELKKPE
jgi:DNA-directed RNA polymerase specialized sigma24 family protein